MAKRKWKGTMTENLRSLGRCIANKEPEFLKGQKVIVWKKKHFSQDINGESYFDGTYEYYYSDENGKGLVRTRKFLLEEFNEPNLRDIK